MEAREFLFEDATGDASITMYEVFPGVQLAYHSVHLDHLHLDAVMEGNLIEIHHCREGRIEQQFEDHFFYLTPGDLSVAVKSRAVNAYHFPLRHYHGITIGVNMDAVPDIFRRMLHEIHVHPERTAKRLCTESSCFILRAEKQIEHVFAELYSVPADIREGYFKIKIMELFLVLSSIQTEPNRLPVCMLSKTNVGAANKAAAYLAAHMDEHVTIAELARMLDISPSHLKTIFKGVYGVPVFSYTRILKMQSAGHELIHTDRSITDIAETFGYVNGSKFASAFQAVMGETPSDYRRAHRKNHSGM